MIKISCMNIQCSHSVFFNYFLWDCQYIKCGFFGRKPFSKTNSPLMNEFLNHGEDCRGCFGSNKIFFYIISIFNVSYIYLERDNSWFDVSRCYTPQFTIFDLLIWCSCKKAVITYLCWLIFLVDNFVWSHEANGPQRNKFPHPT